jgi:hypothetical protein
MPGALSPIPGNDFLEDSPYEAVNSRLSDIFRLAPILGKNLSIHPVLPGLFLLFWFDVSPGSTFFYV